MKSSLRYINIRGILILLGLITVSAFFFESAGTVSSQGGIPKTTRRTGSRETLTSKTAPDVLAATQGGGTASVIVFLSEQADVSSAYEIKDQNERGWYVYNTLRGLAARTQAPIKELLDADGVKYESYWAANMLIAAADQKLVDRLAARPDVARIDLNKPARWIEEPEIANFRDTSRVTAPNAVEPGVTSVNAPAVWALGFTGQGIVIGNEDTGMRWDHDALKGKYRGWNGTTADHNFNWHDAIHSGGGSCGANSAVPCDDQGHGTHTTGTTVGDDGSGNQIGVAPGAKWIGCRNMDQGNGTPATYTECFQFMMAPTDLAGANANPALRPHVINNSWGCPVSEGCTTGTELQTIVNNTQAAGIFVVASAGNGGPACSTVSDAPAFYDAAFSVGAISATTNVLAGFSSRGPGTLAPNLLKPNISAPGVSVRSSLRTSVNSYGNMSGTSMASPHVVGVVALLWSARPQLSRDIAGTKSVLQNTANPGVTVAPVQTCGGIASTTIPNNSFGYGRVDALAAVNSVPAPSAARVTISGRVLTQDGSGVRGARVTITDMRGVSQTALTNAFGYYAFDSVLSGENYVMVAYAKRYTFSPRSVNVTDSLSGVDFEDGQ
jgi:serine protease AprX